MDRRNFLRNLIGGVAASAAVRTFPFRVYSFPSEPTITGGVLTPEILREAVRRLKESDVMPYGIAYHEDDGTMGPWLGLNRSSYKDLVNEFGIAPDLGTRLNFKLPKRSMIVTGINQATDEIILASA